LYKKQKLDVILMDIQMPKKNGFETTIAIRKKVPMPPTHNSITAGFD
jgi:CheY-like chemotaxis protein